MDAPVRPHSEAGIRSLSVVAGTALIPVACLGCCELVPARAGLLAAAFTALGPFMIWYSQEAREYMLLAAVLRRFVPVLRSALASAFRALEPDLVVGVLGASGPHALLRRDPRLAGGDRPPVPSTRPRERCLRSRSSQLWRRRRYRTSSATRRTRSAGRRVPAIGADQTGSRRVRAGPSRSTRAPLSAMA